MLQKFQACTYNYESKASAPSNFLKLQIEPENVIIFLSFTATQKTFSFGF